jgi:hypothetical protein
MINVDSQYVDVAARRRNVDFGKTRYFFIKIKHKDYKIKKYIKIIYYE